MMREKKIYELRGFCSMQDSCDQCDLDELSIDCEFNKMDDEKINELYCKIRSGEDISEKSKTVTDILEEVKQEMCDGYCKYPTIVNDREELFAKDGPCMECPLNKL